MITAILIIAFILCVVVPFFNHYKPNIDIVTSDTQYKILLCYDKWDTLGYQGRTCKHLFNIKKKWKVGKTILAILILALLISVSILFLPSNGNTKTLPKIDSIITKTDTIVIGPGFMSESPKEGLWKALLYCDIKHPEIVYAQAILETGHFTSKGCTRDQNLFGLYNSRKKQYYKFDHWFESVIAYKKWIQNRYKEPEDYYAFLKRIGYAEDLNYINKVKTIVENECKKRSVDKDTTITRK